MTRNKAKEWIEKTCGKGWLPLVDKIYDSVPDSRRVKDVYSKWGSLTATVENMTEEDKKILNDIAAQSIRTCEKCGKYTEVSYDSGDDWGIRIICLECSEESQ